MLGVELGAFFIGSWGYCNRLEINIFLGGGAHVPPTGLHAILRSPRARNRRRAPLTIPQPQRVKANPEAVSAAVQVYEAHMLHSIENHRERVYLDSLPFLVGVGMYSFFSVLPAATVILLSPTTFGLGLLAAIIASTCYMYPQQGELPRLHKLSCYAL